MERRGLLPPLGASHHLRRQKVPLSRTAGKGWVRRAMGKSRKLAQSS